MASSPKITSYPPLGQLTFIPTSQKSTSITVLLDWHTLKPDLSIELELCYTSTAASSEDDGLWDRVPLQRTANPSIGQNDNAHRVTYAVTILQSQLYSDANTLVSFTIRYKTGSTASWEWARSQHEARLCGQLVLQNKEDVSVTELTSVMHLQEGWQYTKLPCDFSTTSLYCLKSKKPIPNSADSSDQEALSSCTLGSLKHQLRFFALVRLKPYWLGPRQGKETFHLDREAILISFVTSTGHILTLITITGLLDTYSVFTSSPSGEIILSARCDNDEPPPFHAYAAISTSFDASCSAVMSIARKVVNDQPHIQHLANSVPRSPNRTEDTGKSWIDGLTFCTWNAIGQDLTEHKLLNALESLKISGISISTLLIDDNWQTLGPVPGQDPSNSFNLGFSDMIANPTIAPSGLKTLISNIQSSNPNLSNVGVWHALMGYWAGIAPSGQIAKDYETKIIPSYLVEDRPATITSISGTALPKFYDDFYTYLSNSGITFVKTDVQHMLSTFRDVVSRRALINPYQQAWTAAHSKYFSSRTISCMSQVPQLLWSSLLQTHTPKVLLRNSDDFWPEIPDSHAWHIWTNAHNSCFTQHLNVVPDWDMMQTASRASAFDFSSYHAAARCISGGPVTITDVPGEHDVNLINQMMAPDVRGRSIALRPNVARSMRVFNKYAAGSALIVGTTTAAGASILGLWNVTKEDISSLISLRDFPETESLYGQEIIVRSYQSKQVFGPFKALDKIDDTASTDSRDLIYKSLPVRGWDILTACPVTNLIIQDEQVAIAVLGLAGKMSGVAAVKSYKISKSTGGQSAIVTADLKAVGQLEIWLSAKPSKTDAKLLGIEITPAFVEITGIARNEGSSDARIISIGVQKEWQKRGLFDSNEDKIEVIIEMSL